ncbi:ZMAT5 protein, partial [Polypterus senegalus]
MYAAPRGPIPAGLQLRLLKLSGALFTHNKTRDSGDRAVAFNSGFVRAEMGKRYYCDYCNRSFQDNLHNRKKHLNGTQHHRAKKAWFDSFRGQCIFGSNCRFSHMTDCDIERLKLQIDENRAREGFFESRKSPERSIEDWLAKRKRNNETTDRSRKCTNPVPQHQLPLTVLAALQCLAQSSDHLHSSPPSSVHFHPTLSIDWREAAPFMYARMGSRCFLRSLRRHTPVWQKQQLCSRKSSGCSRSSSSQHFLVWRKCWAPGFFRHWGTAWRWPRAPTGLGFQAVYPWPPIQPGRLPLHGLEEAQALLRSSWASRLGSNPSRL